MIFSYRTMRNYAINLGFSEVKYPCAYMGYYYIKDGKKFVFHAPALKAEVGVSKDAQLVALGYDTDTYKKIEVSQELSAIFADFEPDESGMHYLSDGMYLMHDDETGLLTLR